VLRFVGREKRWRLLPLSLQTTSATTKQAGQHHKTPKHNQFFFFSPEECSGHHETRKKYCSRELFKGIAHAHMGSAATRKTLNKTTQIERKKKYYYKGFKP
jgi:hypothetical protein